MVFVQPCVSTDDKSMPTPLENTASHAMIATSLSAVVTKAMMSEGSSLSIVTATEFTLFPLLPKELRLEIFRQIERNSSDVHVRVCPSLDKTSVIFKALTLVPTVLHLCQESREEGLKRYKAIFEESKGGRRCIYVDFQRDTLYMQLPDLKTRRCLRRIAERMKIGQVPLAYFLEEHPGFDMFADDTPQAPLKLGIGMAYNDKTLTTPATFINGLPRLILPRFNELNYCVTAVVKRLDAISGNEWDKHRGKLQSIYRDPSAFYFLKEFAEMRNWDVVWQELREDLVVNGWYHQPMGRDRLEFGLVTVGSAVDNTQGVPQMDWGRPSARWCFA